GIDRGYAVALYMPNTPWHPIVFFGVLRTGAHIVHLSPLDAERELIHKLADSGARTLVTVNLSGLDAKAVRLAAAGHVDRVIVADDAMWELAPTLPFPTSGEGEGGGDLSPQAGRGGSRGQWHLTPAQSKDGLIALERLMAEAPTPSEWPPASADDIALLQYTGA